ncbi:DUF6265 family protein [Lutibacter sp.]|uniref:DUF6265 family protein n=1 Tax=Lutibacter sp. TaxID=1925666 RepID=UPI002736F87C|nr:DUF6265 family protein [Lutibacter sp.]MDP3313237.1 DUF6265 family protein [Lutibacter sp.]
MKNFIVFLLFVSINFGNSQNTLKYNSEIGSPKTTLNDVSWIAGNWEGQQLGGNLEEIWMPPHGDSMMGVFKLVVDGKVQFYEIMTISEENETLIFRIKHFNNNLSGWEEKDESEVFQLVKVEPTKVYFNDFTFEKISNTELNIYVIFKDKLGNEEEVLFKYKTKIKND